jgi:hypothetical protein
LLPRTGKSSHLRWVNKLKPDLKRFFFTFHSDLWPTVQRKELLATTPKFAIPKYWVHNTLKPPLKENHSAVWGPSSSWIFQKVSLDASTITCCNIPRVGEICCMVICSIHLNAFGPSL